MASKSHLCTQARDLRGVGLDLRHVFHGSAVEITRTRKLASNADVKMYLTSLRICQRYCLARRGCPTPTSVHTRLVGSTVSSSEAPAASPSGSGSGSDVYIDSAIPAPSPAPAADAGGTASSAIGTLAARMAAVGRPPVTARSESGELCEPAGFPRASMGTVADAHVGVVLPLSVRLGGMGGAAPLASTAGLHEATAPAEPAAAGSSVRQSTLARVV